MTDWIAGELAPSAIGIIASPIPIVAAITLMLMVQSRTVGLGYLAGWIAAIFGWTLLFSAIAAWVGVDTAQVRAVVTVGQIVLGAAGVVLGLVLLVLRRRREHGGRSWSGALERVNLGGAVGIGFGMGVMNPKLAVLAAIAGLALTANQAAVAPVGGAAIFAAAASIGVAIPVLIHLVAAERSAGLLERARSWFIRHENAVVGGALVVIGAYFLADAAGALIRGGMTPEAWATLLPGTTLG